MDREHVKGAVDKVKGAAKEAIGKATGDSSMVAKGKLDKAKGEARERIGDLKESLGGKDDDRRGH